MRVLVPCLFFALASACARDPVATCRDLEDAFCDRFATCDPNTTHTQCVTLVDATERCATASKVDGDPDRCERDLGAVQCSDVIANRNPPSCDDVRFR